MKLFCNLQKVFKNGFYIDYWFKNIIFFIYIKMTSTNFFYLIDKFLAEKFFYSFKQMFQFFSFLNNFIKNLNFLQILKLIILITLQVLLIILL